MVPERGRPSAAGPTLFAVGLLTLLAQVVLLRELAVASFGIELVYLLALGLWLASGAAGAWLAPRSSPAALSGTGVLLLGLALILPAEIAFLRSARLLFGGVAGAYLSFGRQMGVAALAVAPPGALAGLLFQRSARRLVGHGGTLAAAYAWESAGGVAGGLAATLALRWGVPSLSLGFACALAAALVGAALCGGRGRAGALGVAAGLGALLALGPALDRATTGWNHPGLLESADSPYGRIAVTGAGGQVAVFLDDALTFESQGVEAEAFVHPAALQVAEVSRVLILGGALEGLAAEALRHRPRAVDCVELNPVLFRLAAPHLPRSVRASLSAPGVRLLFDDPRRFLERAGRYDLILVGMPEPSSGQASRFYTREFFARCAGHLGAAGVLGLRLPAADNFRGPQLLRRNAAVYRALTDVFPNVVVLPGDTDVYLGSRISLPRAPEVLADRLRTRGIRARLVSPAYLRYLYGNDRFSEVPRLLAGAGAPANTDARPACYQYGALLWLSQFLPWAGQLDPARWRAALPAACLGALGLFALARRRAGWRRAALAGVAGFGGMAAESVLLLRYQVDRGVLFQDVGVLLLCFMAGLAAGSLALDRLAAGREVRRSWGAALLGAFAVLAVGLFGAISRGGVEGLAVTSALLVAAGALSGGLFGFASRWGAAEQGEQVSPLYGADLLGGCLASLAGSLVLIPLAGLDGTALTSASMALLALILL